MMMMMMVTMLMIMMMMTKKKMKKGICSTTIKISAIKVMLLMKIMTMMLDSAYLAI